MIDFHIAFDELDSDLGHYFESSKNDLVNFIQDQNHAARINEIHSRHCNQAFIDIRISQVNSSNFVFIAYAHGHDDGLLSNKSFFIKKNINSDVFRNSLFYSMSCLTGRYLGKSLIEAGSHGFIGYSIRVYALLGVHMQTSIDCDNFGIKNFIQGLTLQACYEKMKQHFTEKIDLLEASGEILLAAYLLSNREALVLEGNPNLTIADFIIN